MRLHAVAVGYADCSCGSVLVVLLSPSPSVECAEPDRFRRVRGGSSVSSISRPARLVFSTFFGRAAPSPAGALRVKNEAVAVQEALNALLTAAMLLLRLE